MKKYASGGRPAESDPNNPMNKEGRTLVREEREPPVNPPIPKKKPKKAKGGSVKKMAKGGSVKSSASRRGDGCAQRGKTRGRMI